MLTSNIVPSVGLSGVSWVSSEEMMSMLTIVVTERKGGFQRGVTFFQHGSAALRPENPLLIDVSERKQIAPMYSVLQVVTTLAIVNSNSHSGGIHIHAAFDQPVLILSIHLLSHLHTLFHGHRKRTSQKRVSRFVRKTRDLVSAKRAVHAC